MNDRTIQPKTIIKNIYGMFPALIMLEGIKLNLFATIGNRAMDLNSIAERLNVKTNMLSPLLFGLVMAGLLNVEDGLFTNTHESYKYLGHEPADFSNHVRFLIEKALKVLSETAITIRKGEPQAKIDWSGSKGKSTANFFRGQFSGTLQAGRELAQKIEVSDSHHILDVAGGSGGVAIALCESFLNVKVSVIDLPEVVSITREFITEKGLTDRIDIISGDVVKNPPDGQYNAAVLRSFIQVLSPDNAKQALKNIGSVIASGGAVYIIGRFLDDSYLYPEISVAHNLIFLNLYNEGRAHTGQEYHEWLSSAGFIKIDIQYDAFSDGSGLITAYKP